MAFISPWTDDRNAELTKLYAEGYSCAQIALELGNTSRNAVIGRIHRMGLAPPFVKRALPKPQRAPRKERQVKTRQRHVSGTNRLYEAISNPEIIKLRCVEIIPRGLSLVDLEANDCRYPYGDEVITFCGQPKMEGSSYCVPHHSLAWVPATSTPPKARIYRGTDFARSA